MSDMIFLGITTRSDLIAILDQEDTRHPLERAKDEALENWNEAERAACQTTIEEGYSWAQFMEACRQAAMAQENFFIAKAAWELHQSELLNDHDFSIQDFSSWGEISA